MAMTLIREEGMQGGAHAQSSCWSLACSLQLLQGSGTQAKRKIRYLANRSLGRIASPWHVAAVMRACGFACTCGSVLITSHPLLCGEHAGSKPLIFTISPCFRQGRKLELLMRVMALPSVWSAMRVAIPFISVVGLLSVRLVGASQDSGSVIPAESTYLPCALLPFCCIVSHFVSST